MKFFKKHDSNEDSFWLSATDMMAGILVVVILLLMLFLLYLNNSTDKVFTPLDETTSPGQEETQKNHNEFETFSYGETVQPVSETQQQQQQEQQQRTEPPTEVQPGKDVKEGYDKAAVFVTIVDDDSGNIIKKSGIGFELYADKNGIGGMQTLHTYYQEKIEYKKFETGDYGTFYLPEKITAGTYSLHNLNAPEGYYVTESTEFDIDDFWDWSEPYMVTVHFKPIKKTIRVSAQDADTSQPLKSVRFKLVASEDITSSDGTVRIKAGDVADEITTDEKGYAESKELYIGKYYIRQETVPEFYAVDSTAIAASVSDNAEDDTGLVKIDCRKTAVTVRLTDERTQEPIEGAVYSMDGRDDMTTDKNGEITVTDLGKSAQYELRLKSVPEGYIKKERTLRFSVDGDGLVDGKSAPVIDDSAYMISLTVAVEDLIFGRPSKGVDLQLTDERGTVIDEWTTNDRKYIITGLSEGKYYVQRIGDEGSRISVNLADRAELQTVRMQIWDTIDLYALLLAIGVVIIGSLVFIFAINRRKKVGRKHE